MTAVEEAERGAVLVLCNRIGFGRVMQLCEELWRKRDPDGALTVGPAAAIKDKGDRVDLALARQLQGSMEQNARMANRLKKLAASFADAASETPMAIAAILRDEEPTW